MFTNKVRQQLYSSNLSQYCLYQTTVCDLGQLQMSRNPLLYLSGRQDTTHVYLFNFQLENENVIRRELRSN